MLCVSCEGDDNGGYNFAALGVSATESS
jgi:hypothetical protein